jgi:hypothetical protein
VRWEWQQEKLHVQRICDENYRQKVVSVTTKRERTTDKDGNAVEIEHVTTREEWRIYPELLRLYCDLGDSLARINGMNTKNPRLMDQTPRRKLRVYRADGATDGRPDAGDGRGEPAPN